MLHMPGRLTIDEERYRGLYFIRNIRQNNTEKILCRANYIVKYFLEKLMN